MKEYIIKNDDREAKKRFFGKKQNIIITVLIFAAVLYLAFGGNGKEPEAQENNINQSFDFNQYKKELSSEAEEALSKISGAGKVKVILSFESMGKSVVARNSQSKLRSGSGSEAAREESKEINDSVVVYGQGQSEKPYVTEEKMPLPSGVLVIAQGAKNEKVSYEIYEAVKALYGLSPHRIKVVTGNENN